MLPTPNLPKTAIPLLLFVLLASCSEYKMDTFEKWCKYQIEYIQADMVSMHRDAIREDFVRYLNDMRMQKVEGRIDRMVWQEGKHLHIVNLSSLLVIEPEEIINQYKEGIECASKFSCEDDMEKCLYGAIFNFFDDLAIHSAESDSLGVNWTDHTTIIPTNRKEVYLSLNSPVFKKDVEAPDF